MTKGLSSLKLSSCLPVLSIGDKINVEAQLLLPEYCPDIERVIALKERPSLFSFSFGEKDASLSGMLFLNLIYESEEGKIKSTEYSIPFKKSFSFKESLKDPFSFCRALSSSLSFKLISKRHLEVRGSLSIEGTIWDIKPFDVLERSDTGDVVLKTAEFQYLMPYKKLSQTATVREEFLPPEDKRDIGEILDTEIEIEPVSSSAKDGSLKAEGSISLHILYSKKDKEEETDFFTVKLPFKWQSDDLSSCDDFIPHMLLSPLSLALSKSEEVIKEEGKLLFEGEILVDTLLCRREKARIAEDAFSPNYKSSIISSRPLLFKDSVEIEKEVSISDSMPSPSDMREIVDAFAKVKSLSLIDEDERKAFFNISFEVLYKKEDGKLSFLSHSSVAEIPICKISEKNLIQPSPVISDASAALINGKVKLSCHLSLKGFMIEEEEKEILTDVALDETKALIKDDSISMIIFYADKSDNLWDVGKKYKVDPLKIKEENSLENENFKERTPLIIPL